MGRENGLKYKNHEVKNIQIENFIWTIDKIVRHLGQINAIWDILGPF